MNVSDNITDTSLDKSFSSMSVSEDSRNLSAQSVTEKSHPDESCFKFAQIENILRSCKPDLTSYLGRFKEAFIVDEAIEFISVETAREIFKTEIGLRGIFLSAVERYKGSTQEEAEDTLIEPKKPKGYTKFRYWKKEVSVPKMEIRL